MNVEWIPPRERFDNLSVSNVVKDGRAQPLTCVYRCPRCGESVLLTRDNLELRARRRISNLPPEEAAEFDRAARVRSLGESPFLDWRCPKCGVAARVYVRPWAGGRHGDSGCDIIALIEHEVVPT